MTQKRWPFWMFITLLFFVFLFLIKSILLPFVLGIFIAYFLDPAADHLETWRMPRWLATLVIILSFFVALMLLSILIVPVIAAQLSALVADMPDYVAALQARYEQEFSYVVGILPPEQVANIKTRIADFSGIAVGLAGDFASGIFHSGMAFVHVLLLILITPIVAFYLLRDWDRIVARLDTLLPREHAATIREQLVIIDRTLAGFIRGQLNVCLLIGTYYAIGLSLVGLKFGVVIGLSAGLLLVFPYVGQMLTMGVALCLAFLQFDDSSGVIAVLAIFLAGQAIEGYVITPKLVGSKVGLHPVWIIFGMMAGAALFGFVGILLAVPVTAVIGVLLRFATARYLQSNYYKGGQTAPRL